MVLVLLGELWLHQAPSHPSILASFVHMLFFQIHMTHSLPSCRAQLKCSCQQAFMAILFKFARWPIYLVCPFACYFTLKLFYILLWPRLMIHTQFWKHYKERGIIYKKPNKQTNSSGHVLFVLPCRLTSFWSSSSIASSSAISKGVSPSLLTAPTCAPWPIKNLENQKKDS